MKFGEVSPPQKVLDKVCFSQSRPSQLWSLGQFGNPPVCLDPRVFSASSF